MTDIGAFEIEETPCSYCGKLVRSYWDKETGGMLSRPAITLVAGWLFHSECWDKQVAEHPIGP